MSISEKNAAVLFRIRAAGACEAADLSPDETERAEYLAGLELLKEEHHSPRSVGGGDCFAPLMVAEVRYRLTPKGEDALAAFEQVHQEKTEAKRQQRFENQVSVASVLVPLITFVLGLIVEHMAGIVGWVISFFE
ncbi:MAG: hypothetical protein LUC39_06700 [Clostridiales bacterium]|nr:hypothetical protein [Clostridiales bacterium]